MKKRKLSVLLCGLVAASVISVGVASPAQAAPKKYVKEISSVTVDGKKVKKNATYKMNLGDTAKIKAAVKVKGSAAKSVTFSSSKKSVATVSSKGTLSAKKAGTATITVKSKANKANGKKATYSFKVKVNGNFVTATVAKSALTRTGKIKNPTTKLSVKAAGVKSSTIKVSSSKTSVVAVKKNATKSYTLTGKKAGTAKITVKATGTNKKAYSCTLKVTVKDQKATGLTVTKKSSLTVGQTDAVKVTVKGNPVVSGYTIASSDKAVATVSGSKITAKKPGKTTITVKSKDGAKKATYTLTVKAVAETLNVTSASELKGFTLSDIVVSDTENFLTKDVPGFATALGLVKDGSTFNVTVGDTKLAATYNKGVMTYTRNGVVITPNKDTFKGIAVAKDETITFSDKKIDSIIDGIAGTTYTTSAYTVSCKVNGTTVSASNVKITNGVVTFTTEGTNFKAVATVANGKHSLVVTNTSNTAVKFSATKLGKAAKAIGLY